MIIVVPNIFCIFLKKMLTLNYLNWDYDIKREHNIKYKNNSYNNL